MASWVQSSLNGIKNTFAASSSSDKQQWNGAKPTLDNQTEKRSGSGTYRFNAYQKRVLKLVWCNIYQNWFILYCDLKGWIQGAIAVSESLECWIEQHKHKIYFRSGDAEDPTRIYEFRFMEKDTNAPINWQQTIRLAISKNLAEPEAVPRPRGSVIDLMSYCNDRRSSGFSSDLSETFSMESTLSETESTISLGSIAEGEEMDMDLWDPEPTFDHGKLAKRASSAYKRTTSQKRTSPQRRNSPQKGAPSTPHLEGIAEEEEEGEAPFTRTVTINNKLASPARRATKVVAQVMTHDSAQAAGPRLNLAQRRATMSARAESQQARRTTEVDLTDLMQNADTTGCVQNHSLALASLGMQWMGEEGMCVEQILKTCKVPLDNVIANTFTVSELYNLLCLYVTQAKSTLLVSVAHLDSGHMSLEQFVSNLDDNIKLNERTKVPDSVLLVQCDLNEIYDIENRQVQHETVGLTLERTGDSTQIAFLSIDKTSANNNSWTVLDVPDEVLYAACSKWSVKARRVMGFVTLRRPNTCAAPRQSIRSQYNFFQADTFAQTKFENPRFASLRFARYQQPLNTCNISALAFGLSMIGIPTTIDEVYEGADLPLTTIVDVGMTLKELFEVAQEYISSKNLPLTAEVWQPPEAPGGGPGPGAEEEFMRTVNSLHSNDALLLNFNAKIAHGRQGLEGGHFSLLATYNHAYDQLVVADVNPKKYNQYWVTPVRQMLQAMADHDTGAREPRGYILLRHQSTVAPSSEGFTPTLTATEHDPRNIGSIDLAQEPECPPTGNRTGASLQEIETLKARIQRLEDEKECLREVAKELESENNALEKKNTVLLEQLHSDHSTQDHQHYDSSDFEQLSSLMSSELQMDLGLVASLQLEGNQRRTSG